MSIAAFPYSSFTGTILSSQVMANFTHLRDHYNSNAVETSGNQTVAGIKTFSSAPVCSAGLTVSASGITVTGNSTITGTLGGLTGLTVASGGITVTAGNLTLSAGQAIAKRVDDGDSGAAKTIDWNAGNWHRLKLTDACTLTLSNPATGASYLLEILQDTTGSRLITWPAAVINEPTLTTTGDRKDFVSLVYNGVVYVASLFQSNVADTT